MESGIFATRSPARPNPAGLSMVELLEISGNILRIHGIEMLDGSPVINTKPYVPDLERCKNIRKGWLERIAEKAGEIKSDGRFW